MAYKTEIVIDTMKDTFGDELDVHVNDETVCLSIMNRSGDCCSFSLTHEQFETLVTSVREIIQRG